MVWYKVDNGTGKNLSLAWFSSAIATRVLLIQMHVLVLLEAL